MSRILLLRHAKAAWPEPGMRDYDRPLTDRGRTDAQRIGAVICASDYVPARVICSGAVRTRQTWEQVAPRLDLPADTVRFDDTLYDGDAAEYLAAVRGVDDCDAVMLVGHNPMTEDLAAALLAGGSDSAMRRMAKGFPTSGVAVIRFDCPLRDVDVGGGRLEDFLRPVPPAR